MTPMVQRGFMPSFEVKTPQKSYPAIVERGVLARGREFFPRGTGKVCVVTTEQVWGLHGKQLKRALPVSDQLKILTLPEGEANKRFSWVESLAEQMMHEGADRTSLVIG